MSNSRRRAERYGQWAEHYAALVLRFKGYHIIDRRHITPFGEIDLIAIKGRVLIFIEVKYRRDKDSLTSSLTPKGQGRIMKAAHYYTSRTPKIQKLAQRFDLVLMAPFGGVPLGYIRHMKDAWRPY